MSLGFRRVHGVTSSPGRPLTVLDALFEGLVGMASERLERRRRQEARGMDAKTSLRGLRTAALDLHVAVTRGAPARTGTARHYGDAENGDHGQERRKEQPVARACGSMRAGRRSPARGLLSGRRPG